MANIPCINSLNPILKGLIKGRSYISSALLGGGYDGHKDFRNAKSNAVVSGQLLAMLLLSQCVFKDLNLKVNILGHNLSSYF